MPRKKRKRRIKIPANQGSLAYISAIFIKPLLKQRPENTSVSAWLNFLFCTHERAIKEYLVRDNFVIPGKLRILPQRNALGKKEGFRKIKSGSSIWVRVDSTVRNRLEVETQNAQGGRSQLFELNTKQWKTITPFLKQAPKRRKKRPKRTAAMTSLHLMQRPNVPKVV